MSTYGDKVKLKSVLNNSKTIVKNSLILYNTCYGNWSQSMLSLQRKLCTLMGAIFSKFLIFNHVAYDPCGRRLIGDLCQPYLSVFGGFRTVTIDRAHGYSTNCAAHARQSWSSYLSLRRFIGKYKIFEKKHWFINGIFCTIRLDYELLDRDGFWTYHELIIY